MRAVGARSAAEASGALLFWPALPLRGRLGLAKATLLREGFAPAVSSFAAAALRERRFRGSGLAGAAGRLTAPRSRCCSTPISFSASTAMASITRRWSALPVTTASSCISHSAVVPGSTSAGAASRNTSNNCRPALVGNTHLPSAASRFCFFRPLMISARVAGVPMPFASFSRSRTAGFSTKRQAFCMASISVPSL